MQGDRRAVGPVACWEGLDGAWQEAFRQAWDAVTTGNIGVGAVIVDETGGIVAASRNRVADRSAPPGEIAGSSLAHAEMNALARLPFRSPRRLVLSTTLQPCLQCAAAIRMGPIAHVRIAGADPLWDGCGDFSSLNQRLARRGAVPSEGPRHDEIGTFATLLSRLGPGLVDHVAEELRHHGEGPVIDLAEEVEADGTVAALRGATVQDALVRLWPRVREVARARGAAAPQG